jgi:hypothetical protein
MSLLGHNEKVVPSQARPKAPDAKLLMRGTLYNHTRIEGRGFALTGVHPKHPSRHGTYQSPGSSGFWLSLSSPANLEDAIQSSSPSVAAFCFLVRLSARSLSTELSFLTRLSGGLIRALYRSLPCTNAGRLHISGKNRRALSQSACKQCRRRMLWLSCFSP